MNRCVYLLSKILLLLLVPTASALAQGRNVTWIGATDNFWDVNLNWIDDQNPPQNLQPFAGDNAIIPALGTPTVRFLEQISNLTNAGAIKVANATLEMFGNSVHNDGTVNIGDNVMGISQFRLSAPGTLDGNGEVILARTDTGCCDRAQIGAAGGTVTHAATHTIRGEGRLFGTWINQGIMRAEETTGDTSAVLNVLSATIANHGILQSSPTAQLNIQSTILTLHPGGRLIADTDNISLTGATSITGGTLESVGGAVYDSNGLITLSGVTVNTPIDNTNTSGTINDARIYIDSGGITNNSTITLAGQSGRNSLFGFTAPSGTLDGNGEVVLAGGNNNTMIGVFPGSSDQFTQGAHHTIRGAGIIAASIINNGTIRAEPGTDGATLSIQAVQINNSLMEAGAGAILRFNASANVAQSATGRISAADGGTVQLATVDIHGGQFETAGSGVITVLNTGAQPSIANVTNLGKLVVPDGANTLNVDGNLINDGQIEVDHTFTIRQHTVVSGTGNVVLTQPGVSSLINITPGTILTNAAGHTIRGDGEIRGLGELINNGMIAGDSAAELIDIRNDRLSGTGLLKNVQFGSSFAPVHAPGLSTAVVPLEGVYTIVGNARLEMEIGGLTPGAGHDQLSSTGTVTLGGTLDVSLINGFVPGVGDRFTIIESAVDPIAGTFNLANLPTQAPDHVISWLPVEYNTHDVTLEVASVTFSPDGDFNNDGNFDCVDVNALTTAIASGGSVTMFDLNGDGLLNLADVDDWRAEAGDTNLGPGRVYTVADANLDGFTDGGDFIIWNAHKFSQNTNWCDGNFNADLAVDGSDFILWNANKFTAADGAAAVPEPGLGLWIGWCIAGMAGSVVRRADNRSRQPFAH